MTFSGPNRDSEMATSRLECYVREEAGTHRYNVGTDTPKLCATSCGGVPLANRFLAALTLPSVIWRFRPPTRPWQRAASSPATGTLEDQLALHLG